jgi:DNA-binding transcriptional LysR family regulator
VSLRLEIGFEEAIMQGLVQGTIDIGVMYTPESRPGLAVEHLFDEAMVLVTSNPLRPWPDPDYIHVDWGPEFHTRFGARFPEMEISARSANIGWLAYQMMLSFGGSAYLPVRMVRREIEEGRLWRVHESSLIKVPVYMVFPLDRDEGDLGLAVGRLRELGAEERSATAAAS